MESEEPKKSVDDIAEQLIHLAKILISQADAGREFPPGEILAVAKHLQDFAADLQLAASRLP